MYRDHPHITRSCAATLRPRRKEKKNKKEEGGKKGRRKQDKEGGKEERRREKERKRERERERERRTGEEHLSQRNRRRTARLDLSCENESKQWKIRFLQAR